MFTGTVSAKKIGLTYGNSNVTLTGVVEVEFDPQVDELDATTGEDGGYGDTDTGVEQATVRIKGQIDIDNSPYLTVYPGTDVNNVKLYHALDDVTPFAVIPKLRILRATKRGTVRGKWEFDVEGKTRGSYTVNK